MESLLADALTLFLVFRRGEGLKAKTLRGYQMHIQAFIDSLPSDRRVVGAVRTADIATFQAHELERLKIRSVRGRHRALDIFFNWLSDNDELGNPPNPMRRRDGRLKVKPPRLPKHEPRRAKLADVRQLLAMLPGGVQGQRDHAVIQLLLDTGLRVGEAAALDMEDIDLNRKLVTVRDGKGGKFRVVPFSDDTVQALLTYLAGRPDLVFEPGQAELPSARFLFVAFLNDFHEIRGRLTVPGIQQLLKRRCKQFGLPHINPHSIRHLFGEKSLNDGMRLEVVSEIMGHSDPGFTKRVYAPLLSKTVQKEYELNWTAK